MACLQLFISGRVQGVWYRESMKREAERLGVTGWVRNLPDGRVEAVIYGSPDQLMAMQKWAAKGPPLAKVIDIAATPCTEDGFQTFEKRS